MVAVGNSLCLRRFIQFVPQNFDQIAVINTMDLVDKKCGFENQCREEKC